VLKRPRTPQLTLGAHKNLLGDDWGEWQVRALYGSSHFQLAIPIQPFPIGFMSPQRQLGVPKAPAHPASFQRTSSMFLKACSNMVVISKRPRCGLLLRPSLGTNAVLAPNAHSSTRIVFIALVWLCGRVPCLSHGYSAKVRRPTCAFICVTAASEITSLRPSV
jgi:hypothetical protein